MATVQYDEYRKLEVGGMHQSHGPRVRAFGGKCMEVRGLKRGCCIEAVIFPNLDTRDVELTFILILTLTCVPFKYLWDFPALGASVKY